MERGLREALSLSVEDGVLHISALQSFSKRQSSRSILKVTAPAGLAAVEARDGATVVLTAASRPRAVAGGVSRLQQSLELSVSGTGAIIARNVAATSVAMRSEG